MKTDQEMIDEVMDCFEFEKVAKAMEVLGWLWVGYKEVPILHEIKQVARKHLKYALERGYSLSGGFEATYDKTNDVLALKFVIESWDSIRDEN